MQQYKDLLKHVLIHGRKKGDRTGTGTLQVFGYQNRYNLGAGLPVVTTKRVPLKLVIGELLWFLEGSTNDQRLRELCQLKDGQDSIWNEWKGQYGELGPIYGKQWVSQEHISLVKKTIYRRPEVELDQKLVSGVGFNGELRSSTTVHKLLYGVWNEMLHRCYDIKKGSYANYGALGVFVDERWFNFETFVNDVQKLSGWGLKKDYPNEYDLDKDFSGSNKYGPDTCRWMSKKENTINTNNARVIICKRPDGEELYTMNVYGTSSDYNLDPSSVYKCIRKEKESHKGWTFEVAGVGDEFIPRVRIINQVAELINDIKYNPNSRRHIVSAWNPADIPNMALAPCHCLFQFDVTDGELSCQLYQRSADAFLGVPFNITSYALLTYMIAHVCNLKVGTFVHTFGDLHIYNNHVEQVKEVLRRDTRPLPQLKFARKVDSIFDFKPEDFIVEGYNPHPTIKAEVAV